MKKTLIRRCIVTMLAVSCGGLLALRAQEPQQGKSQERPRKVGTTPTPKPSPAVEKASDTAGEEVDDGDVVRVDTQLVSVPVIVTNKIGRPVANLRANNFIVFENGSKQEIVNFGTTDAPFEIALLLDTSGSTRDEVVLIRRAAIAFINALRAGDRVSIIAFNTAGVGPRSLATVDVLIDLTSDRDALRKALDMVGTSNGTPYYDALVQIADEVFKEPPAEEVRGRRAIVALTDGVDSASLTEFEEARQKLKDLSVATYFIQVNTEDFVENRLMSDCRYSGALRLSRVQLQRYRRIFVPNAEAADYANFCQLGSFERMQISRNLYNLARQEMKELARVLGGKTFVAADISEAKRAFAQVAEEIGTQYSLGYYPSNKSHDGTFRQIRVEMRGVEGGTTVRAREGYFASKE